MRLGQRQRAEDVPVAQRRPSLALRAWRRARQMSQRWRILTDVVGALLIVGILAGALAAATGGVWPPILVVESESMMHNGNEYHYGRIGSIDVGDIVFIRGVHGPSDIHLWVDGGPSRYGRPGDVITYAQNGDRANTTIIHRAITWIDVVRLPDGSPQYRVRWFDGQTRVFGAAGIYLPELGFDGRFGYTPDNGYKPAYSGFITKGDNGYTNPASDQALGISAIVDPAWVNGKAYGEVPWLGLAKLALQTGVTNPDVPGFFRVGNAFAPLDLWTCFFASLVVVLVIPLTLDTIRVWRGGREGRVAAALARRHERDAARARRAERRARKAAAKAAEESAQRAR